MDRIRTRLLIAVSSRLASAADTEAKADLVEELGDNLYQRYLDLTASGVDSEAAYGQALEDLGDVDELLSYLETAGTRESRRGYDAGTKAFADNLAKNVDEIVRETVSQAKVAAKEAKGIAKDLAAKLKEKYPPKDFESSVHVSSPNPQEGSSKGWTWSFGYNKDRGGFFADRVGEDRSSTQQSFPADEISSLDVSVTGDVTLRQEAGEQVLLVAEEKDMKRLSVAVKDGALMVRPLPKDPQNPAKGQYMVDVELCLPQKVWDAIHVNTASGDVFAEAGLAAGSLLVQTAGGDVQSEGFSGKLSLQTYGGDVSLRGLTGEAEVSSTGGDVSIAGSPSSLQCKTTGGDVRLHLAKVPFSASVKTTGGDVKAYLPETEAFTLMGRVSGGEFSSELPLEAQPDGSLTHLGGGAPLELMTSGGDVSVRRA